MLTVRFPNGNSMSFESAVKIQWDQSRVSLLNSKDEWVASVGHDCIIEAGWSSSLSNPFKQPAAMIGWVLAHLREMPVHQLAQLKSALNYFDSRKRRWK